MNEKAISFTDPMVAIKTSTRAFGNFIDPERDLVELPNLALVEVDLPEYQRNGLGRALLKVVRYDFTDLNKLGAEGLSICADRSTGHVVYADMNPTVVGTHDEIQERLPKEVREALYQRKYTIEMVSLAALRYEQFGDLEKTIDFIEMYRRRATWMETHTTEVRFANVEESLGCGEPFDWDRIEGEDDGD